MSSLVVKLAVVKYVWKPTKMPSVITIVIFLFVLLMNNGLCWVKGVTPDSSSMLMPVSVQQTSSN